MTRKDYQQRYTDPELRERLKEQIKQSDKGGNPGQWSARKSQLLTREYEKHGGGYTTGRKGKQARRLEAWTAQAWRTRTGAARARHDGETDRYLPDKAWQQLTDDEAEPTDRRKREASRTGRQYVPNTDAARRARRAVMTGEAEPTSQQLHELARTLNIHGRSSMSKAQLKRVVRKHYSDEVGEMNKHQLYDLARDLDIHDRSHMTKGELRRIVGQYT
ncbi:MAG: hypothetical protein ACOC95_01555 [Planctomycetota bacterium]